MSKNFTTIQRIKQLKNVLAVLFLILILWAGKLQAQVTVSPGVGGPYATVNAAFAAINAGTHTGAVTIAISANTTEPAAPTVLAANGVGAANYSSITIYPTSASVVVAGASTATNGVLVFNGADNITINGNLNNGSGTTRNLTIQNTPAAVTTAHSVLWFQGTATAPALGCTNIVVKNTNIQGNGNLAGTTGTTTYSTGIVFVGTTAASSTTLGANHDNITISNNLIKRVTNGIHMGNAIATPITNLIIQDNEIGSAVAAEAVYYRGMWLSNISGAIVRRNHVFNIIPTLSTQTLDRMGIEIAGTGSANNLIERNHIHGLATYSTSGYGGYGININGGNNHTIVNNLVYDIQGYGWTTQANCPEGIRLSAGTGHKVYYNSVHLYGQLTGTTTRYSAAFVVAATTVTGIDVRNNIFSNQMTAPNSTTTENMVMWFAASYNFATAGNTINNNGIFLTPASANHIVGKVGTTVGSGNSTSLGAWQTASSGDANSVPSTSQLAPFTSNTNLTIPVSTSTLLESGGIAIASLGLPNSDYTATSRPAGTGIAPDIGAYEFEGIGAGGCTTPPTPGTATATPNSGICPGATIVLDLTGASGGIGQTYQWQSSATSGSGFTNIGGSQGGSLLNTTATTTLYYRCLVTCSGNTQTSTEVLVTLNPALPAGTYTINSALPTGGTNYQTFNDAVAALSCGIAGPIVFHVDASSGPYVEQVQIGSIFGTSAVNTITFNGNGRELTFAATLSTAPGTFVLNGADYIVVNNLTISSTGTTYGLACHLWNGANNNSFTNCTFTVPADLTPTTLVPFSISGSATSGTATGTGGDNNTVTGCTMNSGYYNTTLVSGSNNQVINCTILNFYFYGVYVSSQIGSLVSGNTIQRPTRTNGSTFYGVYVIGTSNNNLVEKNRISRPFEMNPTSTSTAYGIYCSIDASPGSENKFYNNLISDMSGDGLTAGLYLTGADYVKAYHNTISLDNAASTAGTTYGIYSTGTLGGIDIKNNMITVRRGGSGTKYCLYFTGGLQTSNYNNLFINSPAGTNYVGYNGTTNFNTLLDWQGANGGIWDQQSADADPNFTNPGLGNYQPNSISVDDIGTPVGVSTDILNNSRSLVNPDIGAYEFTIPATIDLGAFELVTPAATGCYSDVETIVVKIKNYGSAVNFTTHPTTVTCNVTGAGTATLTGTPTGILGVNQTMNVTLTGTFDMSVNGVYNFDAFTTCASDLLPLNNSMTTETITRAAVVAGTLASSQTDLCLSGAPVITLTGSANGSIQWQSSTTSATGPWTNVGAGLSTYSPGTISTTTYFQAITSCLLASATSNVVTVTVNNPSLTGTNSPQNLCGTGSVNFTGTASPGSTLNWYAAASGGTPLFTGSPFTTPVISTTTNYWVAASAGGGGSTNVGALSPSIGTTSTSTLTNHFMIFDVVTSSLTINTVTIYPTAAIGSNYDIVIQNSGSTQIFSTGTFTNTVTGGSTPQVVTLNATLPAGTGYRMGVITNAGMTRNTTGASYPYSAPGYLNITGNTFDVNYWYYFYDWSIVTGCESSRTMVTANVTAAPTISPSTTLSLVCSGGSTTLNVSSSNPDYTYTWMPGSLTGTSVNVNPASTQIYTVTAVDNSAGPFTGCTQVGNVTITAQPAAATIVSTPEGFCLVGGSATLTLNPSSGYPVNSIQWQDSPNNSVFNPIVGAVNPSYVTPVITSTTYYKAQIKDGNNAVCLEPTYSLLINDPQVLTTTPGSTTGTGTVNLSATSTPGSSLKWYAAPTGGTALFTGPTFTTPPIGATTNYYVSASAGTGSTYTGKPTLDLAATTGGGLASYTNFDAYSNFILETVDVYPFGATDGAAGTVTVELRNSAGTSLMTQVVNVIAHSSTALSVPQTITLNFPITPGTGYRLGVAAWTGGVTNMYRNDNGVYPYTVPGVMSITGASIASPPYVYFYYNWKISTPCESGRTAVQAEYIAPALDASIALNAPAPPSAVAGMNTVSVNISNLSVSTTITDLSLSYTDGIVSNTESFSGLNILAGTSQIVTFLVPYNVVNTFNFSASILTVNGVPDASSANNTTTPVSICVGLAGNYTINSTLPTSGTNFNNLVDVGIALSCGISGPVVFDMQSSFTEQVTITPINGASAVNTITFNGNGNSLSYAATVSTAPHTLALNGADYLRFNDLTFNGTGGTYALVCHLWNGADNNMFTNCTFNAPANGTSTTQVPFSISGSATSATAVGVSGNNNIITGCTMFSGYYNTTLVGASATPNTGNQVINCNILDQYFYGIYCSNQNGAIIRGNNLSRPTRTTLSTFYGVYVIGTSSNMLVEKNTIRNTYATAPSTTGTTYNIYCTIDATAGNENKFINNLIADINFAGTIYGMYMSGSDYWKAYHNTISLNQTSSTSTSTAYGIYCTGTVNYDVRNNLVYITRGGASTKYCVYYSNPGVATSNNNNLYINAAAGTNYVGYNGVGYTTLSAWQAANPSLDNLSASVDPLFINPAGGNYTPNAPALNGIGASLGIVDDLVGTPRTANPDPGAIEFGIAVAPPSCASVTVNNVNCISATSLSWPYPSGFPSGTLVYVGTDGGGVTTPISLVAGQDIGIANSITLPALQAGTLYYYYIEPYNALGSATGCTIGSFTSGSSVTQTPTQSPSSYTETMDNNVTPPALPCGMTSSNENFPADAFTWYTASGAANAHAGTRYLRIDKNTNNTTPKDDWIYSAPMNLTGGKLYRIYFWHRVGTAGSENFEVFLSNSSDAATMLTTSAVFTGASNLLTYKLDSTADIIPPFSGIYYYGIHANGAANGRSLYMDDIQVKQVPVAAMDPASCITVPSLYDQLLVQPVYQAQDYKFKIENLANSFSYEYTHNTNSDFRLKWAPGVTYDLSYDVSVSYKKNNVWSPYGPSCVVTMGPFPTTQLRGASCGATLTDLYTPLYIDSVGGANDYEYRIVQNTLAYDHTWMRGAPVLDYRLYWAYQTSPLLVERVQFGFTYDVQVRALVGRTGPAQGNLPGTMGTFGPTCTVTLNGQPQTQLVAAPGPQQSCGKTLTNITDQIFCIPVVGASNYRYTAVNAALGYNATADRNSTLNDFRLNWLPTVSGVGLRYATTYDITVQNNVGGVWSTAGTMCQVTTPAQPLTQLQPAYCLYTLPTFSTPIYCNAVPAATNYRYRITDVATSGATYTKIIDRNAPSTDFRFTWTLVCCGGLNVLPNTPYNVEVASYAGGVWSAYGTVCTVTTSATVPRYNPFLAEEGKVETAAADLGLSVYPNPSAVNETYYIELNGIQQANEKVVINIYNVLGAKVYSTQVITKEESRVVLQPEQTLAAGVYTVEAQINGTVSRVKFVVK
ncbi:MAG: T9SS type A sorting domain-containing protein [Bacteroidetes bacterium]|nr:T9SS type A sorting domain-containing protein [Bacteroidota bacterium]